MRLIMELGFLAFCIIGLIYIQLLTTTTTKVETIDCVESINVDITYYNLKGLTACEESTEHGIIALSRDLFDSYSCGELIKLDCNNCALQGYYRVSDKLASGINNTVDVWDNTYHSDGRFKGQLIKYKNNK